MREAGKSVCGTIRGVMADLSILLSQPTVSVLYFVDSESTTEMEMVKVQMICIQKIELRRRDRNRASHHAWTEICICGRCRCRCNF
jgi:hypothetical protein